MSGRALVLAVALVAAAVLGYGAYRLYLRSVPPAPVVVLHDADLTRALRAPLGERVRAALFGRPRLAGPKLIALTFDDGPYPVDTPQLLAVLHGLRLPATFFLIGQDAEHYPGLVRAIAAQGFEIADHTQTHPNLATMDDAAVADELIRGAATLGRSTADPAVHRYFRPPHGRYREATLRVAQRAGFDTILWTDDPGDWRNIPAAKLLDHIARFATTPEILLLHSGRPSTTRLLPDLAQRFRAAGYTFVTVGELLRQATAEQLNRAARSPLGSPPPRDGDR
jgi:peptidoglycan/xylan/chitin deacetylase (PgdA/CDA1 family)